MSKYEVYHYEIFTLDGIAWQISINGLVLPHTWNSKGAAIAGLRTELLRLEKKISDALKY
jgi:hypothetical protein